MILTTDGAGIRLHNIGHNLVCIGNECYKMEQRPKQNTKKTLLATQ